MSYFRSEKEYGDNRNDSRKSRSSSARHERQDSESDFKRNGYYQGYFNDRNRLMHSDSSKNVPEFNRGNTQRYYHPEDEARYIDSRRDYNSDYYPRERSYSRDDNTFYDRVHNDTYRHRKEGGHIDDRGRRDYYDSRDYVAQRSSKIPLSHIDERKFRSPSAGYKDYREQHEGIRYFEKPPDASVFTKKINIATGSDCTKMVDKRITISRSNNATSIQQNEKNLLISSSDILFHSLFEKLIVKAESFGPVKTYRRDILSAVFCFELAVHAKHFLCYVNFFKCFKDMSSIFPGELNYSILNAEVLNDSECQKIISKDSKNEKLDPEICYKIHDFPSDKIDHIDTYLKPFSGIYQMKYEKINRKNEIVIRTYHNNRKSLDAFISFFNKGKVGNCWIEQAEDIRPLKERVFEILREKMIDECLVNINECLKEELYKKIMERIRHNRSINALPTKQQPKLSFYISPNPIKFHLSAPSVAVKKIKKAVKKLNSEKYRSQSKERLSDIEDDFESIKQPPLYGGSCSRLAAVRPIPESVKREYIRAYACARQRPLIKSRDSKSKFRQTQFPDRSNQITGQRVIGKRTYFEKSTIQGFGLFALENISKDALIAQYNGELIRSRVADFREKYYEKLGFPHMFLFRIDADKVVDATLKGSMSRFMNHCCSPNCRSEIITLANQPTISFYSIKPIKVHEELTFNYLMEYEDISKAQRCYCGAPNCNLYLNYRSDEQQRLLNNSE